MNVLTLCFRQVTCIALPVLAGGVLLGLTSLAPAGESEAPSESAADWLPATCACCTAR